RGRCGGWRVAAGSGGWRAGGGSGSDSWSGGWCPVWVGVPALAGLGASHRLKPGLQPRPDRLNRTPYESRRGSPARGGIGPGPATARQGRWRPGLRFAPRDAAWSLAVLRRLLSFVQQFEQLELLLLL